MMKKESVIEAAMGAHGATYGVTAGAVAWAPGRIEVLGNHTDYNEGTVLSAAIQRGHCFCISQSNLPKIRLHAVDVNEVAEFDTADTGKVPGYGWANYVKGVFFLMQEKLGRTVDGLDCTFYGSIPMGSGLSSSAALEVAAAYALLGLLPARLDGKEVARLCQRAEQEFAGTNCGLLDQFSSIFGRDHGLIHSDFRSVEVTSVTLPSDIEFLVVNPRVQHSLVDSPYNDRRERCEQAAAQLAPWLDHPVTALRDVSPAEFEENRCRIDPVAARRAAHVVSEIHRVECGMAKIQHGDMEGFGRLLFDSHQSSIENFENSCRELDVIVNAAREAGALGARLSGGGFGGSAIVMIRVPQADSVATKIDEICRGHGLEPDILTVVPSAGAEILEGQ